MKLGSYAKPPGLLFRGTGVMSNVRRTQSLPHLHHFIRRVSSPYCLQRNTAEITMPTATIDHPTLIKLTEADVVHHV